MMGSRPTIGIMSGWLHLYHSNNCSNSVILSLLPLPGCCNDPNYCSPNIACRASPSSPLIVIFVRNWTQQLNYLHTGKPGMQCTDFWLYCIGWLLHMKVLKYIQAYLSSDIWTHDGFNNAGRIALIDNEGICSIWVLPAGSAELPIWLLEKPQLDGQCNLVLFFYYSGDKAGRERRSVSLTNTINLLLEISNE